MDDLTLFSSNHRIIQSCTKFIRVLFVRKKSNRLKPQDVTYNGQGIPSSPSVKFLGITFDSAITFRSHFHTVATLARHRLLKLNSIFSSTYGPSTSTLICLYKSYIRSLLDYGAPAICVASPNIQLSWERMKTHSISRALSIPSFIHNDRKRQHAYLPPIHDKKHVPSQTLEQAHDATQPRGTGLYRPSHDRNIRGSRTTPLELIKNYSSSRQAARKCKLKLKQRNTTNHLLSDKDPCGWPMKRFLFFFFYFGNPKNCQHKKYEKTIQK